jgi:CelD/BcsL family acetyltransferase involved in cellulose biosynthesis
MHVDIIEGAEAIRSLRAQWDAIYDADPEAQYFLSWTWLSGYVAPMGRDAFVLAAKPNADSAEYVALLPLRLRTKERPNVGFHNEINVAGNYVSDYTGFICRPGFEEQAIPALADKLMQLNWMQLRLEYFCASARRSELFLRSFSKKTFEVVERSLVNPDGTDNSICPFTTLEGDWDKYLEGRVNSNTRQKIRRFLRQVERSEAYRITHTQADTVERDIELLLSMWTTRWGPRKGNRLQSILSANRGMLRQAFSTGTLFLPVLWHDEHAICALAFLVDDRKKSFNFYVGGRDESFKGPPPGLVLHAYAIRHAISNGITKYDFLRGNEPYKYSFGCEERHIKSIIVRTRDRQNLGGKLDARSVPTVLHRAMELQRMGQLAGAERGYRQVLDVDSRNAKALYLLGQLMARRGDHVMAAKHFKAVTRLMPDFAVAWQSLGKALQARQDWAGAANAFREAAKRQAATPHATPSNAQRDRPAPDLAGSSTRNMIAAIQERASTAVLAPPKQMNVSLSRMLRPHGAG